MRQGLLVVLGAGQWMISVAEYPEFGVIDGRRGWDGAGQQQILVFFGLVQFGDCPAFALLLSMHTLLIPVGDEGTCMKGELPWSLGMFLL